MAGQKNGHGGHFCVCLRRLADLFHPAAKMDQRGGCHASKPVQWQELEKTFTKLRVLDLDIKIDRTEAFNLFIKKFQSVSLLEEYLRSSPYVMDQLKKAKIDELDLHRAIVALSEKMKAVDDNASKKKDEPSLYTSWTLSFTAPTSEEAQTVLSGYIDYISTLVVKESLENVRNKLEIKPV